MIFLIKTFVFFLIFSRAISIGKSLDDDEIRRKIDDFINGLLQCNNVPGLGLAVVRNGQTFMTKGYGVKNIDNGQPITEQTKFHIASITKSFVVSTLVKVLENKEDISFSTPIRDILGENFYLSDPYRTKKLTLKDALSHRTGLPRNDVMRFSKMSLDEMIYRIRYLEFSEEFRDVYMYNNLMYVISAYVIEALDDNGKSWEEVAKDLIIGPLNMTETTFVTDKSDWNKYATGYGKDSRESNIEIDFEVNNNAYYASTAPGGIGTNAIDMIKYMKFFLSNGKNENGGQLVEEEKFLEMRNAIMPILPQANTELGNGPTVWSKVDYGLGLFKGYNRGYQTISHGGSQGGFLSDMELIPKLKNGVFVSSNANGNTGGVHQYATTYINDLLATGNPWLNLSIACNSPKFNTKYPEKSREALLDAYIQKYTPKRTRFLKRDNNMYIGRYGNFAYGNITIYEENQELFMSYGPILSYKLEPFPFENVFYCQGQGIYWYINTVISFDKIEDDKATEATTLFEVNKPPTFVRGRLMTEAPAPPEPCD